MAGSRVAMIASALAALLVVAPTVHAASGPPGTLDRRFGEGGRLTATVGAPVAVADVASLRGGDVLVAGHVVTDPLATLGGRLLVRRYDTRGRLRRSFGRRGTALLRLPQGLATASDMAVQPDGAVVLAGEVGREGTRDGVVVRLDRRGRLDPSFGDGGVRTLDLGSQSDRTTALALQPDGAIVVAGTTLTRLPYRYYTSSYVGRLLGDGRLDPGFGTGGIVALPDYGADGPIDSSVDMKAVTVRADGAIVTAGTTGSASRDARGPTVALLTSDGCLDPALDGDGVSFPSPDFLTAPPDLGVSNVAAMVPDPRRRRLHLAGNNYDGANGDFLIMALDATSLAPDPTFGRRGVATVDIAGGSTDYARAVVVDGRGRIVLAGSALENDTGRRANARFALARFLPSGRLDRRFGQRGRVRTAFGRGRRWDVVQALALRPGGGLLAAGSELASPGLTAGPTLKLAAYRGG